VTTQPSTRPDPATADGADAVPAGEGVRRAASARLAELPALPVVDHVAVFEDVHRVLTDALAGLDASEESASGGSAGGSGVPAAAARPGSGVRPGQPPRPGPPSQPSGRSWPADAPLPGGPAASPGGPR
jgi:hypothetical protein